MGRRQNLSHHRQEGTFVTLEDKGDSCETGRFKVDFNAGEEKGIEIFSSPAISDGRICLFHHDGNEFASARRTPSRNRSSCRLAESLPAEALPTEKLPATLAACGRRKCCCGRAKRAHFKVVAYDEHGGGSVPSMLTCYFFRSNYSARSTPRAISPPASRAASARCVAEVDKPVGQARRYGSRADRSRIANQRRLRIVQGRRHDRLVGRRFQSEVRRRHARRLQGAWKKLHNDKGPILNRSLAYITPPIPAG